MIVNLDENVYYVSWRHKQPQTATNNKNSKKNDKEENPFRGSTQCIIKEGSPKGEIVADATVIRHFKDRFVKKEGRKFSMRKALLNSDIPRVYFGQFWANINK